MEDWGENEKQIQQEKQFCLTCFPNAISNIHFDSKCITSSSEKNSSEVAEHVTKSESATTNAIVER